MEDFVKWAGLGVAIFLAMLAAARSGGDVSGANRERFKKIEDILEDSERKHAEHFRHAGEDQHHFQNTEIHTSAREKNSLERKLDDLQRSVNDLTKIVLNRPKTGRIDD